MEELINFLNESYTAYHAVKNAETLLNNNGFERLYEEEVWSLTDGGKYYVVRGGSALIAFVYRKGTNFKIVASHTDSPCLKLKENALITSEPFYKLNTEGYGGGIWYSFFDRPLKIAGSIVKEHNGELTSENFTSDFQVVIPSLAVHMQRDVNEKFSPNLQVDLLPLLALEREEWNDAIGDPISYDLYAVCAQPAFESGLHNEFLSAPRLDNLTSVYASLTALCNAQTSGTCIAACFHSEEIGSSTREGAGSDFLKRVLKRIALFENNAPQAFERTLASSFMISLDNAHSLHPNHPEKSDLTNKTVMGGGVVIKSHANGAYTTQALSSAVIKKLFSENDVKYQTFYNRSDMRSGSTLGAISFSQLGVLSVDLGIAQLAMHSAVETMAKSDYTELLKGLSAYYSKKIQVDGEKAIVE